MIDENITKKALQETDEFGNLHLASQSGHHLMIREGRDIQNISHDKVFSKYQYNNQKNSFKLLVKNDENTRPSYGAISFLQGKKERPNLQINLLPSLENKDDVESFVKKIRKILSKQKKIFSTTIIDHRNNLTRDNEVFLLKPEGRDNYFPYSSNEFDKIPDNKPLLKPIMYGPLHTEYDLGKKLMYPSFTVVLGKKKTTINYAHRANLSDTKLVDAENNGIRHILFQAHNIESSPEQFPDMSKLNGQIFVELRSDVTPEAIASLNRSLAGKELAGLLVKPLSYYRMEEQKNVIQNEIAKGLNIKKVVFEILDNSLNVNKRITIFDNNKRENSSEMKRKIDEGPSL